MNVEAGRLFSEHLKMPIVIISETQRRALPEFVCVIMSLGLEPLPTVKESTQEEN